MFMNKLRLVSLTVGVLTFALVSQIVAAQEAARPIQVAQNEKKKERDPLEGKKGTTIGTLVSVAKEGNAIEVKADGEEKARRYVPQWVKIEGTKFGGYDPATLKTIGQLKVGSRVEVEWEFHERFRVMKVNVLKAAQ